MVGAWRTPHTYFYTRGEETARFDSPDRSFHSSQLFLPCRKAEGNRCWGEHVLQIISFIDFKVYFFDCLPFQTVCSVLADTSTQTRLFLWDESERKGKSIQDLDCNDPVSWMEGSSAGRSKWIPCHSSLITPASLISTSSHSIYHFLRSFSLALSGSSRPSLTQTGSCSGLSSLRWCHHGCWRCLSPLRAESTFGPKCVQVTESLRVMETQK